MSDNGHDWVLKKLKNCRVGKMHLVRRQKMQPFVLIGGVSQVVCWGNVSASVEMEIPSSVDSAVDIEQWMLFISFTNKTRTGKSVLLHANLFLGAGREGVVFVGGGIRWTLFFGGCLFSGLFMANLMLCT